MNLHARILNIYPKLKPLDFAPESDCILLQDDGDGPYIKYWKHPDYPMPTKDQIEASFDEYPAQS